MSKLKMCRLCLNPNQLIDVFYSKTPCSGINHLRTCIFEATGTNIQFEDKFPKYVCKPCCDVCLRIHEFQKRAKATEKAFKSFDVVQPQEISTNPNFVDNDQSNSKIQASASNAKKKKEAPKRRKTTEANSTKPQEDLICGDPQTSNVTNNNNPVVLLNTKWQHQ